MCLLISNFDYYSTNSRIFISRTNLLSILEGHAGKPAHQYVVPRDIEQHVKYVHSQIQNKF
jgi:hypothetical protein